MVDETVLLRRPGAYARGPQEYSINFTERHPGVQARGIQLRRGSHKLDGPVAAQIAVDRSLAEQRMHREVEVATYLGELGGEVLSRCRGYRFDETVAATVVGYRGLPLSALARKPEEWPLRHAVRRSLIVDLLHGVDLLRISGVVHGSITMDTVHWDGSSPQIVDFGGAGLGGHYPDGRVANHADDIFSVGRLLYQVYTGEAPPTEEVLLRRRIIEVQDRELRDLLLRRDRSSDTDVWYVFASDPRQRPTSRDLLNLLAEQIPAKYKTATALVEEQSRASFRALRRKQARFDDNYRRQIRSAAAQRWYPPDSDGSDQKGRPFVRILVLLLVVAALVSATVIVLRTVT